MSLLSLPTELLADILGALDVPSLIAVANTSSRLRAVCSDDVLNPWRAPIWRNLRSKYYSDLATLSVRTTVPRHNWVDILSRAPATFVLFEATLPNLKESEWEEVFKRRFLPSWQKWKRVGSWRECFTKVVYRVWHRSTTMCTSDEAWTQYLVLNKNGSANALETASRNFDPFAIFDELKRQNNLAHLPTRIRVLVELTDVRILVFGLRNQSKSTFYVNENGHRLLFPPILEEQEDPDGWVTHQGGHGLFESPAHPHASYGFARYPRHTPGNDDARLADHHEMDLDGSQWVGGVMLVAQLMGPLTKLVEFGDGDFEDRDLRLIVGAGRRQYASLTWQDLWALAPWMRATITKTIDGLGLGN